jgi:hypothetical protein
MITGRERLTRSKTVTMMAIEGGVPALAEALGEVARFQATVRAMTPDGLEPWLEQAIKGPLICTGRRERPHRGSRGTDVTLVQWANREADHEPEA